MGAAGLVVYQRLSQNVGLKVTGQDFSQEIATLSTHIERLRQDIEVLRGAVVINSEDQHSQGQLKSVLKKSSRYEGVNDGDIISQEAVPSKPLRHRRNQSWGSGLTASSSGTEYFSAISSDEEDFLTPPALRASLVAPVWDTRSLNWWSCLHGWMT